MTANRGVPGSDAPQEGSPPDPAIAIAEREVAAAAMALHLAVQRLNGLVVGRERDQELRRRCGAVPEAAHMTPEALAGAWSRYRSAHPAGSEEALLEAWRADFSRFLREDPTRKLEVANAQG